MEKFKQDAEFWAWQAEIEKEEQRNSSDTGNDDISEKKNSSSVIGPQQGGRKFHEDWDRRELEEEEKARKHREVLYAEAFKLLLAIFFKKKNCRFELLHGNIFLHRTLTNYLK